ncbi:MAG: type III pantothenate kinase [Candidatus Aureabacteria bacterium]|nr:type III pantothenate kinase [Candidatus Auribacterota bacterium]
MKKILCIDIGNTSIDTGIYGFGKISKRLKFSHKQMNRFLTYTGKLFRNKEADSVSICSVVPAATRGLLRELKKNCDKTYVVRPEKLKTIKINSSYRKNVGADRVANAAAVSKFCKVPALVIDFGTAITFDVIKEPFHYDGSVIFPGLRVSKDALVSSAALLGPFDFCRAKSVICKSTPEAMCSGLYFGILELVDGIRLRIEKELKVKFKTVVGTGGDAGIFAKEKIFSVINEDLTLMGTALLMLREEQRKKLLQRHR